MEPHNSLSQFLVGTAMLLKLVETKLDGDGDLNCLI